MKNGNIENVILGWINDWEDYTTTPNGSLYRKDGVLFSYGEHFPLALRISGGVLINADLYSATTRKHQSKLIGLVPKFRRVEVPFSALSHMINGKQMRLGSYNIDLEELKRELHVVDMKADEWVFRGKFDKYGNKIMEHDLGACVLEYKGRYFISALDPTSHRKYAYFLTELTKPVSTVDEAYNALKPAEVLEAEKSGVEVLRQGEWFFIKTQEKGLNMEKKFTLGDGGHHVVSKGIEVNGDIFVQGVVKHMLKEHKQLKLYSDSKDKAIYKAFRNVQIQSYTSVGNVD